MYGEYSAHDAALELQLFPLQVSIDEVLEAQYAGLERLECVGCLGGMVSITVEEDGEEHDELVPCRRRRR